MGTTLAYLSITTVYTKKQTNKQNQEYYTSLSGWQEISPSFFTQVVFERESESEIAQSCPTVQPHDYRLPGFSIHGIFQARILEWVAISFSRRSSQPRDQTQVSSIVSRCFTVWATRENNNLWEEPVFGINKPYLCKAHTGHFFKLSFANDFFW